MNLRRSLMAALGAGMLSAPLGVFAQQPAKARRIGFLTPRSRPVAPQRDAFSDAFVAGMRDLGYVEGRNLVIEWRYASGTEGSLDALAADLARLNVEAIVAYGTAAVQAAQRASKGIPIVIAAAVDPVGSGLVASLSHPGGNTTGLSAIAGDLSPKHLELLRVAIPKLARVAVLVNPGNASHTLVTKNIEAAAGRLGIEVIGLSATTSAEIAAAMAEAQRRRAGGLVVAGDAFFSGEGKVLAQASARHRIATISIYGEHVSAGCLMSYGQNLADYHRKSAGFVDRILKGTKPADLPVEQPASFELLLNAKTAKSLGIKLPQELVMRADQVIR